MASLPTRIRPLPCPEMTRLTKEQIHQHRSALEQWQAPNAMTSRCTELMGTMTGDELFNQPGIEFIREGWAAGTFGVARKAEAVRLIAVIERWPDFEIRVGGEVASWEFTEADVPGRRRGQEYRDDPLKMGDKALGLDQPENYFARAGFAAEAIRARCEAKAAKRYGGRAALLIYLNIEDFGTRHREIVESFATATSPAKDSFTEIWILWKARIYPVWQNGSIVP
jgi:hypothetical protein